MIKADWPHLIDGLVLIPSAEFEKLLINTGNLEQTHVKQLANSLILLKQKLHVEVRCERLTFQRKADSMLGSAQLEGFQTTFHGSTTH